jgi:hypothetical protein
MQFIKLSKTFLTLKIKAESNIGSAFFDKYFYKFYFF